MPRMVGKKAGEQEDEEKDTLRFVNNQMIDSLHNLFAPSCCGKEGATLSSIYYQGAEGGKGVIAICEGVESTPSAAIPSLAAGSQEPAGRENLSTGVTSAVAEQAIGSDHGNRALAAERLHLFHDPVVGRGCVDHVNPWVVAYDGTLPLVLTWPTVEDDPDLWIARIGEPPYPFDKTALCWLLPPASAVAPEQDSGMEHIESVDNEKSGHEPL